MGAYRAVKIVSRSAFDNDRPFEREFRGIQKFEPISRSHPSQVAILHVGRSGDYFYYVMELADDASAECGVRSAEREGGEGGGLKEEDGKTLTPALSHPMGEGGLDPDTYVPRTLKSEVARRGRLPFGECLEIGLALTTALEHLHKHGLVHRDVKPSNVIFVNGTPKLADIGLVTNVDATVSFVGTEGFIPPEGPGTPRADIYSLGKVLYEISTGKDRQDFPEPPTLLGDFPDRQQVLELGEIIKKACAREGANRYQSAEAMQADLLLLKTGGSVQRARVLERRLKATRRLAVAVVAVVLLGVVPYFLAVKEAFRARRAEAAGREDLYHAYIAQIRSGRFGHEAGQKRFAGLDLVRRAATIRPSLELRNEAIACLAVPDMRLVAPREASPSWPQVVGFIRNTPFYTATDTQGNISVRSFGDDRELALLPGFGARAVGGAFSPDGRFLCTGYGCSPQCAPRIWDIEEKKMIFTPAVLDLQCFCLSADSKQIAIAQKETGPVLLYELPSGRELRSFPVEHLPSEVALDPQGRLLAVSSAQSTNVLLFGLATGARFRTLPHPGIVHGVSFSPDGRILATCANLRIYLWNVSTGKVLAELVGHDADALHTAFSHDGRLLASTSWDGKFKLWSMATLKELCSAPEYGYFVSFSPDNHWLVNDHGSLLRLYEMNPADELKLLRSDAVDLAPREGCDFSRDGQLLAVAGNAGVRFWAVRSGKDLAFIRAKQASVAMFHPSTNLLYTVAITGIQEWPYEWNGSVLKFGSPRLLGPQAAVTRASFADDRSSLALVRNGRVCLLDLKTGTEKFIAGPATPKGYIVTLGPLATWADAVPAGTVFYRTASLSPSGRWCAACRADTNGVEVFDAVTGETLHTLQTGQVLDQVFSPDGRWLITCAIDEYCFWDTTTWHCARTDPLAGSPDTHGEIAFSSDGTIAAISGVQTVRLVDPSSGQELATLESYEPHKVGWFAFSHDDSRLAVSYGNRPVQLWDLRLIRRELATMNLDWKLPGAP
jgi:WD40 repeat protein